ADPRLRLGSGRNSKDVSFSGTYDRHAAASRAGAANETGTTQRQSRRGRQVPDVGAVRAPGVPSLSRRLCPPRPAGGACHRSATLASASDPRRSLRSVLMLAGVRIIESSLLGPGGVGMHLADLGADVIKVENPGGDYVRRMAFPIIDGISLLHWHL